MDMKATASNIHPLDPLSSEELARASTIFREASKVSDQAYFACAIPAEPPKAVVLEFEPDMSFDRAVR